MGAAHEFFSGSHEISKHPLTHTKAKGVLVRQVISLDYECSMGPSGETMNSLFSETEINELHPRFVIVPNLVFLH
jgi:hypothetical protein